MRYDKICEALGGYDAAELVVLLPQIRLDQLRSRQHPENGHVALRDRLRVSQCAACEQRAAGHRDSARDGGALQKRSPPDTAQVTVVFHR